MTASTRNCRLMSRRLAPIALRSPISRVRSVTVVSIMFMIPMPPTTREMPGDRGQQQRQRPGGRRHGRGEVGLVDDPEVGRVGVADLVALEEQVGDVGLQLVHALLVDRLDADLRQVGRLPGQEPLAGR